jgi:hypothetical protein
MIPYKGDTPILAGRIAPPGYRNLYIFGVSQARYGAGSLISLGTNSILVTLIKVQEQMQFPLFDVLGKLGIRDDYKPTRHTPDILADPHKIASDFKRAQFILPYLPRIEKFLISRGKL